MSHRILRPAEAMKRLGVGHSTFYRNYIGTGRLRLIKLGERARGVLESELDALIEKMAKEEVA